MGDANWLKITCAPFILWHGTTSPHTPYVIPPSHTRVWTGTVLWVVEFCQWHSYHLLSPIALIHGIKLDCAITDVMPCTIHCVQIITQITLSLIVNINGSHQLLDYRCVHDVCDLMTHHFPPCTMQWWCTISHWSEYICCYGHKRRGTHGMPSSSQDFKPYKNHWSISSSKWSGRRIWEATLSSKQKLSKNSEEGRTCQNVAWFVNFF